MRGDYRAEGKRRERWQTRVEVEDVGAALDVLQMAQNGAAVAGLCDTDTHKRRMRKQPRPTSVPGGEASPTGRMLATALDLLCPHQQAP